MPIFKKVDNSKKKDWHKLNFMVPITETFHEESATGGFLIRGIAINATTTRNQTTYTADELKKSAKTLRDKPVLKDHNASIDSIVGRTTENIKFDDQGQFLGFEAQIMDEKCKEMIRDKRIKNVSVGAFVHDVEEIIDEKTNEVTYLVKGIEFVEISLVAVPADPNAGFAMAMEESLKIRNSQESSEELEDDEDDELPILQSTESFAISERPQRRIINIKYKI